MITLHKYISKPAFLAQILNKYQTSQLIKPFPLISLNFDSYNEDKFEKDNLGEGL